MPYAPAGRNIVNDWERQASAWRPWYGGPRQAALELEVVAEAADIVAGPPA